MKALRFFQGLIDLLPDFLSSSLFSHLIQEGLDFWAGQPGGSLFSYKSCDSFRHDKERRHPPKDSSRNHLNEVF
jgi:hypothetical protein